MSAEIERIKVNCPNCEKTLVMKAELAGRKVKCPQCETGFTAPGGQAVATKPNSAAAVNTARSTSITVPSSGPKTTSVKPRSWTPPSDEDDEPKPKKAKKKIRSSDGAGVFGPGLLRGLIFGCIAAIVSAGAWALVGALTGMQIGWLAWGVGVLCGFAVAMGCEQTDDTQGIIAAGCAVGGIVLGKFMLMYFVFLPQAAAKTGVPVELVKEILAEHGGYAEIFKAMFSPMDLLFIGLAIFSAYKLGSGSSSND
jgi:ribosomal protein S27E